MQISSDVFANVAAGAVTDVGASSTGARVVRVVRPLVLVEHFVRVPGLVGVPGPADERRHWSRRDVHLGGGSVIRTGLRVVVVEQVFLLLVADVAFAIPAVGLEGLSGL